MPPAVRRIATPRAPVKRTAMLLAPVTPIATYRARMLSATNRVRATPIAMRRKTRRPARRLRKAPMRQISLILRHSLRMRMPRATVRRTNCSPSLPRTRFLTRRGTTSDLRSKAAPIRKRWPRRTPQPTCLARRLPRIPRQRVRWMLTRCTRRAARSLRWKQSAAS